MYRCIKFAFLGILLSLLQTGPLWSENLSDSAKVYILTCSPGQEAYSLFGHSAIRIADPLQEVDLVFNYGMFDFSTPHFYMKFIRGNLRYMLVAENYSRFLAGYLFENRSVYQQEMNLPRDAKEKLFENLLINYRPENRYYRYDFFFDNCATRIRDILERSLSDSLRYDFSAYQESLSFRLLLDPYLTNSPWLDLGIDLVMGTPADQIASARQYMFLPDYILEMFDKAMIDTAGTSVSICGKVSTEFEADPLEKKTALPNPRQVFWGLFLLSVLVFGIEIRKRKKIVWFDRLLFFITGMLGCLFLLLWIISKHAAFGANLNMIWAFPLHLAAVFFIKKHKNPGWLQFYFSAAFFLVLFFLGALPWLKALLPSAIFPILLIMTLRLFVESSLFPKLIRQS